MLLFIFMLALSANVHAETNKDKEPSLIYQAIRPQKFISMNSNGKECSLTIEANPWDSKLTMFINYRHGVRNITPLGRKGEAVIKSSANKTEYETTLKQGCGISPRRGTCETILRFEVDNFTKNVLSFVFIEKFTGSSWGSREITLPEIRCFSKDQLNFDPTEFVQANDPNLLLQCPIVR